MSDSWRKNWTCGACSFFVSDYGAAPTFYGHCKMHPRAGSRSSGDSLCHEFKPLPGFEERVVLKPRTHVPDSSRRMAAPVERAEASAVIKRRRDGEDLMTSEVPQSDSLQSLGDVLGELSAGFSTSQLEDALLDLVEAFGVLAPTHLAGEFDRGMMLLQPADSSLKPLEIDIETFFHKIVMMRDRIRVLEQKVNANSELSDLEKIELQAPITRLYQALSAFNPLLRPSAAKWKTRRPTRRALEELLKRWAPRDTWELGPKWVGGHVSFINSEGERSHEIALDYFYERLCSLKRRFRELESALKQQRKLSGELDTLLDYLSKCYGTLTTFNVLFRHREDCFSSK